MRILLVATTDPDAIRDLLPVAASLGVRFPSASISFLTAREWEQALASFPIIDRIEALPLEADSDLLRVEWDVVVYSEPPSTAERPRLIARETIELATRGARAGGHLLRTALRLPSPWRFLLALDPPQPAPTCLPMLRASSAGPRSAATEWIDLWRRTPTPEPGRSEPAPLFDVERLLAKARERAAADLAQGKRAGFRALVSHPIAELIRGLLAGAGIHAARRRGFAAFLEGALLWEAGDRARKEGHEY
ncbi:MAG: hypothetical protein CME06_00505 [Gemmatimonadetes bacterium]|nr:hypothetical protein [Gemmatimonadota bacterium]